MSLNDQQLMQYSRQIMLPQIDVPGQEKLLAAKVLVLGAGGLGCPVLMYLAGSGIGNITVIDPDQVDVSNLHRQILFQQHDIGASKATIAARQVSAINRDCQVTAIASLPTEPDLYDLICAADLVIEGTDNFASRYQHNKLCMRAGTPLVSGAVIRMEGQVSCFDSRQKDSPCYACLYPDAIDEQLNCTANGVLPSVAGMIASTMVTESIKLITGIGDSLVGRLLILDAMQMEWRCVGLKRDQNCQVCQRAE